MKAGGLKVTEILGLSRREGNRAHQHGDGQVSRDEPWKISGHPDAPGFKDYAIHTNPMNR